MDKWLKKYDVFDVLCNDFDALVSRVAYVQDKEHCIVCLYFFNFKHVRHVFLCLLCDEINYIVIIIIPYYTRCAAKLSNTTVMKELQNR